MKRTTRHDQQSLNEFALSTGHAFQKIAVEHMQKAGWKVYAVQSRGATSLVFLSFGDGRFGVMYPNGEFTRNLAGRRTIDFSWDRADDLAEATIPGGTAGRALAAVAA